MTQQHETGSIKSETQQKMDAMTALQMTSQVACSYLSNNLINKDDVPQFLKDVYATFNQMSGSPIVTNGIMRTDKKPAVPIKKSVFPDKIICLEDGLEFKSLKRHLRTYYNLSPEEYRVKWGLPSDYPMTASEYSERRAAIAKDTGLGKRKNA